jgi:hypothetical protein
MMDEVLQELWNTKDSIAREHGFDMDNLVAYYQSKQEARAKNSGESTAGGKTEPSHPADPQTAPRFRVG